MQAKAAILILKFTFGEPIIKRADNPHHLYPIAAFHLPQAGLEPHFQHEFQATGGVFAIEFVGRLEPTV